MVFPPTIPWGPRGLGLVQDVGAVSLRRAEEGLLQYRSAGPVAAHSWEVLESRHRALEAIEGNLDLCAPGSPGRVWVQAQLDVLRAALDHAIAYRIVATSAARPKRWVHDVDALGLDFFDTVLVPIEPPSPFNDSSSCPLAATGPIQSVESSSPAQSVQPSIQSVESSSPAQSVEPPSTDAPAVKPAAEPCVRATSPPPSPVKANRPLPCHTPALRHGLVESCSQPSPVKANRPLPCHTPALRHGLVESCSQPSPVKANRPLPCHTPALRHGLVESCSQPSPVKANRPLLCLTPALRPGLVESCPHPSPVRAKRRPTPALPDTRLLLSLWAGVMHTPLRASAHAAFLEEALAKKDRDRNRRHPPAAVLAAAGLTFDQVCASARTLGVLRAAPFLSLVLGTGKSLCMPYFWVSPEKFVLTDRKLIPM